jgi:putative ABC transport system permease protein
MFFRLLYQSFRRQRRSKLLAMTAITLGVAVATSMIAIATDIGDKISRELRSFGANILVTPEEDTLEVSIGDLTVKPASSSNYLNETDLPRIKGIFWRHNILGFAPFLPVPATLHTQSDSKSVVLLGTYFAKTLKYGDETFTTGVRTTHPWWQVEGTWPSDAEASAQVLVGSRLASQLGIHHGTYLNVDETRVQVSGILTTGGEEEKQIVGPLGLAQKIAHRPGVLHSVYVSALTKPEDAFARRDPATMSPAVRDRWYCSPYANSIAFQLAEAIPHAHAEQIRQVAQSEGVVLQRIRGLMLLVALTALLAAILAVSAAMAASLMERRREVGLMKAIGASGASIATLFYAEGGVLALLGGLVGFLLGSFLAQRIAWSIFGSRSAFHPALLPLVLFMAALVAGLGSAQAIRKASLLDPSLVLRGDL